jgi:hypothetical protein
MKRITWDTEKANTLKADDTRNNVGFEDCLIGIEEKRVLAKLPNPAYSNQTLYVLDINSYAYVVPFVESDQEIFLKTVFPSRKYTALYIKDRK